MRHHHWSGVAAMFAIAAISLQVAGCSGSDTAAPTGMPESPASVQVALARKADTLLVDRSLRLTAIIPPNYAIGLIPVWSSSDTTVAVVTQGGQVFAVKSGAATIRLKVGTDSVSTRLTVRPSVRFLRFAADTLALGVSQAVELPYSAIDSDGNMADLSQHAVEWNSSAPEIASVTGSGGIFGRVLGSTEVRLSVDGQPSFMRVQVKPPSVSNVAISPSPVSPVAGEQIQLVATATDANGVVLTNRTVTWSSSNSSVAQVSASGLLTTVSTGTTKITAVCDNKRSFLNVTVRSPGTEANVDTVAAPVATVAAVAVTLSPSAILTGQSATATAVVTDAASNRLTDRVVSWTSSDASIASVDSTGMVTGVKAGSAVISGSVDGKSDNAVIVVSTPTLAPRTISVKVPSPIKIGELAHATAVVKDANGTVIPDATVTWTSAPTSVVVVSVNGVAMGRSVGTATVSASIGDIAQSAGITVVDTTSAPTDSVTTPTTPTEPPVDTLPTVTRVAVTLPVASLGIGATAQATATAYDASGQRVAGRAVSWASTSPTVASVSALGLVTALAAGTTTVRATIDGVSGSAGLTVPAPVGTATGCAATPHARTVAVATAAQLSAALEGARAGDLIELADGRYAGHFSATADGGPGQRITLCGTRNAILDGGALATGGYALTIRGSYWVLQGFTVTNTQQGVRLEGSSWSTVRRLLIYNIGQEALNVRQFSAHDTLEANQIHTTGRVTAEYGEAIYVGSYNGVWCDITNCQPDRSDSVVVRGNVLGPNVTAEHIDVKEGTTGGLLEGNTFDGRGMVMSQSWVDSWLELKGNGYRVVNNRGTYTLRDGFQTFQQIPGWGNNNVFAGNTEDLQASGYGIRVSNVTGTTVRCDNVVTNAGEGTSNVPCS